MQSRVLGRWRGELVVNKAAEQDQDDQGEAVAGREVWVRAAGADEARAGRFDVERREMKPGLWQITETHVHIEGKALFFKTIGQQEDEVQTEFRQVPAGRRWSRRRRCRRERRHGRAPSTQRSVLRNSGML